MSDTFTFTVKGVDVTIPGGGSTAIVVEVAETLWAEDKKAKKQTNKMVTAISFLIDTYLLSPSNLQ
jgi:hypothetical protein